MAEYEKLEVISKTDSGRKSLANFVLDTDTKEQAFYRWWLEDLSDVLAKKRGVTHQYKAGVYEVRSKKRGKALLATILLVSHTATTPEQRKGQTRISRTGKISVKILW